MTQLPNTTQHSTTPSISILPTVLTAGAFAGLGLGLALIAWSRNHVIHNIPLTAALNGELVRFTGRRSGRLAYYMAGPARPGVPPMLLIHSINAAASSFEMKPLFDHYARTRRVIALDLPGYGFSERSDRAYTPALMRDAILDVIEQELEGQSVDAVGLSLSAEYLALAAQIRPLSFRSFSFLTPTGFSSRSANLRPSDVALRWLRVPLWARPIYDLLTSRPSLTYFIKQNQRTPVKRNFIDYAYASSHQPDAELAPFHFLSFKLFTPTIMQAYRQLTQPCALIYGRDPFATYDLAGEFRRKPNWRITSFEDAGSLVHWDNVRGVLAEMEKVLK